MVMPLLVSDEHALVRLRSMKRTATGLLLVAAAVYAASLQFDGNVVAYVRAGSEAAMVGGLADWFAVTALFRRPLGLPIPHTGLVPRKKDELATKLGQFVTEHFLTREVVVAQLHEAAVLQRVATMLRRPDLASRIARELSFNTSALLGILDEDAVVASALELLRRDQARRSYAPVLGRVLDRAVAGGTQRPLVDVVAVRASAYLRSNREQLLPSLRDFVDERGVLAMLLVSDKRLRAAIDDFAALLSEIAADPRHQLRRQLDGLLGHVAQALQTDRQVAAQIDLVLLNLLDDPQAQAVLHDVVTDAIASVRESLSDADGALHDRLTSMVVSLGERIATDLEFRSRIERTADSMIGHVVENYGDELTRLIRGQVEKWDATDASRNIELAVGRDLQFIRINGTAVGALAGLAIHTLTLAVS
jgi:uncharacterized membrane-anchored protein YjiN (DUF445 family)